MRSLMDVRMMSAPELAAEIGQRVKRERLRQNVSQGTLAEKAGLSRATIARMEAGETTTVTGMFAVIIALGRAGDLEELLKPRRPVSIEEFLDEPTRKRGRR